MKTSPRLIIAGFVILSAASLFLYSGAQESKSPEAARAQSSTDDGSGTNLSSVSPPAPIGGAGATPHGSAPLLTAAQNTTPIQAPVTTAASSPMQNLPAAQIPSTTQASSSAQNSPSQTIPRRTQSGKVFDPRFVQPATRMMITGERTPEIERQILADEAQVRAEKARAIEWAKANGWPIEGTKFDGGGYELMRLDENGKPVYYETFNERARISHNVEPITQFADPPGPASLEGSGWLAGMWENGPPRLSHIEFNDFPERVVYKDSGPQDSAQGPQDHATHVLGTILGNGFADPAARGMAWRASAWCFGWNDDNSEMQLNGATAPDLPAKLYVSNHSYGVHFGWVVYQAPHPRANGFTCHWVGQNGATEAEGFGQYGDGARARDITCRRTPYLLPFFAAGNSRYFEPFPFATVYWTQADGTEASGTWGFVSGAPPANGSQDGGFDTLLDNSSAKNPMIVGNMKDAWSNGERFPFVGMVGSSSCGPADDGRIKPDIVANGEDVLSATFSSDTATALKTGTSMAAPGATGTGLLLHEHYHETTGQYLRASTLKALMIHSATDVQTSGPDYQSGWGLIDAVAAVDHLNLHVAEPGAYHLLEGVLALSIPEFRVTFTASGPVKATLVWTDPEGAVKSGLDNRTKVLVNDLDLVVRAPDGTLHRAPQLDPNDPNATATFNGNDIDNVEMVGGSPFPIEMAPGVYELTVTYKGSTLVEPDLAAGGEPKQVFSLMLHGNAAVNTGTVGDGVDKPARAFAIATGANACFAFEKATGAVENDRATNLDIGDNQKAGFETAVTGPTTVTFTWGVSSEANFDFLRFYSNGVKIAEIAGNVASNNVTYNVPAGSHILRWNFEKDGSLSSGSDAGWVDNLELNDLPEAVDNLNYSFTQPASSSAPWRLLRTSVSSVRTNDLAESGNIAAGQTSAMQTIIQGPAVVRFRMVQTGPTGQLSANWQSRSVVHTGGNTFSTYSIEIGAGPQAVTWQWFKPQAENGFGYVDELVVIPQPTSLRNAADLPDTGNDLFVESFATAPWVSDAADAAPSGPGGERGASSIHTLYTPEQNNDTAIRYPILSKGGVVSFWWQASGAPGGNLSLQIRHSGTGAFGPAGPPVGPRRIAAIPGGTGWQQVHLEVPPGFSELRWFYDATTTAGYGWIDQIEVLEGVMHPARGLDRWGSRWQTFGHAPWHSAPDTTNGGIDTTTHGLIGDSQSTSLTTTVVGPKKLFFQYKVSSEAGYDFARFEVDGEDAVAPLSGESGWHSAVVDLPAGTHFLRWLYEKDGSVSTGEDRAFIDGIALLRSDVGLGMPTPNAAGGFVVVPVRKDPTAGFFLEQSTDLVTWTPAGAGGMISPSHQNVNVITSYPGPRAVYRLRYKPEIVHAIENASFEQPNVPSHSLAANGPGWGPDDDGVDATSFERVPGFAAAGAQHLSIDIGKFSEMKGTFIGYRGVHSVLVAIGHRDGFTQPGNLSHIVLTSGIELGRISFGASQLPADTWFTPVPPSFDSFEDNLNAAYSYKVRLESTGTRSFFDHVRVISEPQ